ncbi:MAG: PQQ-binding-like beta-propeller repeat protein [Bacteriovoracaceae bacterium]|jgi:outer membrane protein assembly factor BamB|nr:hypothetical protein [Halobacteriovoraceae bacterium]MDP7321014.1 PQQ-binding-like beta-propeller repeat protein [Bacteriovoracaceae bacterium]
MRIISLFLFCSFCVSCAQIEKHITLEAPQKEKKYFDIAWIKNLDPTYNTGNLPIGTSSPYIFEDILYMGDLKGRMSAYNLHSGRVIWQKNEKTPIQSQVNKRGDYIYYGTKTGRLFSRHYLTGKLNYAIDLGTPIESQPSFIQGRLILHLRNHSIVALDAKTGKIFWRYKRSVPYVTTLQRVSNILPYDSSIILGFADGHIVSLSLEEGVVKWEQKISTGLKFVDVDVTPVYFNNYIVAGSAAGPMRMLNPESGSIERTIEIVQSHTPIIIDNQLYVGSIYGEIFKIDEYGKILLKNKISKNGISSITKWKNGLAITTMGHKIYQISAKDFSVISSFDLGNDQSAVFGNLVSAEGKLSVYSSRNRLYVFK